MNCESTLRAKWKLTDKEKITENLYRFDFCSKHFQVKPFGHTFNWFARHFILRRVQDPYLARTYTTAFSLKKENAKFRQDLIKYFEDSMSGKSPDPNSLQYPTVTDELSLFIKYYDFKGGLAQAVHQSEVGKDEFYIEGPLGRGILLGEKIQGDIYFISAGTGILPFLDLMHYFLIKTMHDVLKQKKPEADLSPFERLGMDFSHLDKTKIHFIGAFRSEEESYGLDIVTKLAELSTEYELPVFIAMTTCKSGEHVLKHDGRIDEDFLMRVVKPNGECYYVCGTPSFNREIPGILEGLGVEKESIVIV
jgi:NAD(P)H-flavin reductase